jgi:hypothetical protein
MVELGDKVVLVVEDKRNGLERLLKEVYIIRELKRVAVLDVRIPAERTERKE